MFYLVPIIIFALSLAVDTVMEVVAEISSSEMVETMRAWRFSRSSSPRTA